MTHVYKHISCLEVLKFHNNDSKLEVYLYIHICICMYFLCVHKYVFLFSNSKKDQHLSSKRKLCDIYDIV